MIWSLQGGWVSAELRVIQVTSVDVISTALCSAVEPWAVPVVQHRLVPMSPHRDEPSELAELLSAHGGCSRRKLTVKHTYRELCSLPGFGTSCKNKSPAPGWGETGQARAGVGACTVCSIAQACSKGEGQHSCSLGFVICSTCKCWSGRWVTTMGRVEESNSIISRIPWPLKAYYWCVQLCFPLVICFKCL